MPDLPAAPEATSLTDTVRRALACVEDLDRDNRLFVLLDALACAESSSAADILMTGLLAQLGAKRKPLAFYDWMESQRRELMGLGAGYLGTEFWCNMSPALRFELCRMAVADPDIAPLLKGLGSRNQRVRESENWLALAQVAAMHANDDALFVQLYRLKPALAQRRIH